MKSNNTTYCCTKERWLKFYSIIIYYNISPAERNIHLFRKEQSLCEGCKGNDKVNSVLIYISQKSVFSSALKS